MKYVKRFAVFEGRQVQPDRQREDKHYQSFKKLQGKGYEVLFDFKNSDQVMSAPGVFPEKIETTAENVYEACKDIIFPTLQNICVYQNGEIFFDGHTSYGTPGTQGYKEIDINKPCYVHPGTTNGRYDVNASMSHSMTPEEKLFAKSLYKGRGNTEYHFRFLDNWEELSLIVSKTGASCTIVLEGHEWADEEIFAKMPYTEDFYLREGMVKPERAIEIVKGYAASIEKYRHAHRGKIGTKKFGI